MLQKLLFFCAGADYEVLERCPIYERCNYISIGIIVIFTSIFAGMTGGYSFYTIFESLEVAGFLGIMWGFFILNIDRLILGTMRKGIGFWRQCLHAIPRLILAALIAITIAHPLKLRLFQDEIGDELKSKSRQERGKIQTDFDIKRKERQEEINTQLARSPFYNQQKRLEERIASLNFSQTQCEELSAKAKQEHECECKGTCGTMKEGRGPQCTATYEEYKKKAEECARLRESVPKEKETLNGELARIVEKLSQGMKDVEERGYKEIEKLRTEFEKDLAGAEKIPNSFLARSETLSSMEEKQPAVRKISLFIMLLLAAVELMPVFIKNISPFEAFDEILSKYKQKYFDNSTNTSSELFKNRLARRTLIDSRTQGNAPPARTNGRTFNLSGYRPILLLFLTVLVTIVTYFLTGDGKAATGAGSLCVALLVAYWNLGARLR